MVYLAIAQYPEPQFISSDTEDRTITQISGIMEVVKLTWFINSVVRCTRSKVI